MKRRIALLLAVVMILGTFSVAFAESAVENPGEFLEEKGVLKGDLDGDLNLDKPLERRDAVIMLSRLLGVEKEAKAFEEEGLPTWKDITDDNYKGYLAWAQSNKYFQGHNEERFGFRDDITVKEYAVVLMRALGYVEEAGDWKAAYDKAVELGLLEGVEKEADVKVLRGEMAQMTVNALETKVKDSEETLAEKLEIEMPVPPVVDATKVEEVYADNLKEVVVVFDGEVDKASAELKDNYSLDKGDIKDAKLSEDLTEVVLVVEGHMENQKERELTVRNVKAGENKINDKVKFVPVDKSVPEVVSVEALGNKAVKVTFSEPVDDKTVAINGFRIDGKAISGSIDKNNGRTVIVKLYNKLSDGSHEVEIKGIKDFAGYLMVTTELEFEVVEDKEAPAIESVEATLEYVTVKFTEPVQDSTVKGGNYAYWKATESSTDKKKAANLPERLEDDTYKFDFTNNALPGYPVYLYIEGVKDYSDNTIAKDSPVLVEAQIDQVRPEIVSVKVADDNKSIEIKFTKAIKNIKERDKYVLKDDKDKKISIQSVGNEDNDKKAVVNLYSALKRGTYTLELQGLTDKTALKNAIMPYTTTLEVKSAEGPKVETVSVKDGQIYIQFNRKMTIDGEFGVANPDNYIVKYDGKTRALPEDAEIEVFAEGKTVIITMPEKMDKKDFVDGKLTSVTVQKVKDIDGVQLDNYSQTIGEGGTKVIDTAGKLEAEKAILEDSKTVVVKFNQIVTEHLEDIKIEGGSVKVEYHELDGSEVKLTLKDDLYSTKGLKVVAPAKAFESVTGAESEPIALENDKFEDEVAPVLKDKEDHKDFPVIEITTSGASIKIEFSEELTTTNKDYIAGDFIVVRGSDDKELTAKRDYTAELSADKKSVILVLKEEAFRDKDGIIAGEIYFDISLRAKSNVKDLSNNSAEAFENIPTRVGIELPKAD